MTELVPVSRTIVDRPEVLERLLREKHRQGRLLSDPAEIRAAPTTKNPDLWWVRVQVLEPAPRRTLRERLARLDRDHPVAGPIGKALALALLALAAVVALVLALIETVTHLVPAGTLAGAGGALLVVGVVLLLARGSGGRHSSHNGKGWHYTKCK